MEREVYEVLESAGLTKTEAIVYLALVRKGASTAYRISKEAQVYKANTYMALDSLIRKNLAIKTEINGKQIIKPVSPEEFINNIDKQREKLQSIIPLIQRNFKEEYEEVSVFTGLDAFFKVFYQFLEQNQSIYVFDIPDYVPDLVRKHIDQFHKVRIKKKVKMYHIYDYNAGDRIKYLKKMRYTYAKQGQKDRLSLVSTFVCGNTTLIVNWKKGIKFVKIVDKDIADTYRHQFDILWDYKS